MQSVRLKRGNQTGYRVNVDGIYLDNANGSQAHDLEIRKKDSLLVFVELTAAETFQEGPISVEDDLVFTLESGVEQKVLLQAWVIMDTALDADMAGAKGSVEARELPSGSRVAYPRHTGGLNIGFLDGHAEWIMAKEPLYTGTASNNWNYPHNVYGTIGWGGNAWYGNWD